MPGIHLFFYGTLLDGEVLVRVLGVETVRQLAWQPAALHGWRRVRASVGDFPMLERRIGGRVEGAVVGPFEAPALLRALQFEGEEYLPEPIVVRGADRRPVACHVFMPSHGRFRTGRAWHRKRWEARTKRRLLLEMQTYMQLYAAGTFQAIDIPWRAKRRVKALMAVAERRRAAERHEAREPEIPVDERPPAVARILESV